MQYSYIGKAIEVIGRTATGAVLVDCIASALSKKNKAQVVAINNELNFSFPLFRSRPGNVNDLINIRRAALLVARTVEATGAPRLAGRAAPYESWDEMELDGYIARHRSNSRPPTGTGAYLAGTFWAYATEEERSRVIAGYKEAIELCTFGLAAATQAMRGVSAGPYSIYLDMLRTWFGDAPAAMSEVRKALLLTLDGLKGKYVRFGYAGRNVPPDAVLVETGFGSMGAPGSVRTHPDKYGFVDACSAHLPNNRIMLGEPFFDTSTTIKLSAQVVAIDDDVMQVTRSGGVLHEATHLYAKTQDVRLNKAAHERFGMVIPKDLRDSERPIAYGTQYCLALARTSSESAVKNADSYRIFCEVAKYHRLHEGAPVVIR